METNADWTKAIQPLIRKYKGKKHPLEYRNFYELLVMVILSAQSSDKLINNIAPKLFDAFPTFESLGRADAETLAPYLNKVINFTRKGEWLIKIGRQLKNESDIPKTMEGLTALPGIGRKSASVIMREMNLEADGIIVDLHVIRVAPRLGIAKGTDAKVIEKQLMEKIHEKDWGESGMAFSFLGREICRPTDPQCDKCPLSTYCTFFQQDKKK
ncbi:MAG: endonuclease III [Bacteroidetes bacterium]|nr:endonuclease III [Bacteroidota bacterium]